MISWYLNRLKTFSIGEYPYRVKQLLQKKYEKVFLQDKCFPAGKQIIEKKILEEVCFEVEYRDAVIKIFGRNFNYSDPKEIDWHKDIFSNQSFPKAFSKSINILSNPALSAKVVWEINRLQFLMKIAISYNSTKDDSYLFQFIQILKSWISNNPYLTGVNWYSNIEVNLRLINWFLCWEVLDADKLMIENKAFKEFAEKDWLPSIYCHCKYSYQNPSKYSSANNHLISEYSGLFVASSKWKFEESEKWNQYSKKGLEEEIVKQHSLEGINKEEAAEYIQFITDFFLIAFIVGERTQNAFSSKYKCYLHNIFKYIFNFLESKVHFPPYGDEDDGKCFIVDFDEDFNNFKSLLTSGAIIFHDARLKNKSNGFDLKNNLLFGEPGRKTFEQLPSHNIEEKSEFYNEEGHFFFRKKDNDEEEIYLHFDAAPLGFLSIAAHGHADALSIILHVDGNPILVDPGTYIYHTEKEWRNYFISTLAHNTICIDRLNQAVQGGPTLWVQHYKTKVSDVIQMNECESVTASHNGYKVAGCSHKRTVDFARAKNKFTIIDQIDLNQESHEIFQPWHLHPLIETEKIENHTFQLKHKMGNRIVKMTLDPKLNSHVITGQSKPILGWYSPSFMQKEKTSVILGKMNTSSPQKIELQTEIEICNT
jgi:hypothetical protein